MKACWAVVIASLSVGCARGSAELLDATIVPVREADASDVTEEGSEAGTPPVLPDPEADATTDCVPGQPDCLPAHEDASVPGHDSGLSGGDAQVGVPDGGSGGSDASVPVGRFFLVRQVNAALQEPLATNIMLQAGDQVHMRATGSIWPGLFGQGCSGPDGTSGDHTGSEWPLQGGPDFALVAHLNGAWTLVGSERSFTVTLPGPLLLGTNDDDNGSGDDCTSVPLAQQGFGVTVEVTSSAP
jgi:hypothetical protein